MSPRILLKSFIASIAFILLAINTNSQTPPVTTVGAATLSAGTYSVPVTVTGFVNVGNISLKLNYDASKLVYTGVVLNTGLVPANALTSPTSDQSGVFRMSYISGIPVVLGSPVNTLFTLTFTVKPEAGGQIPLTWSTFQGDCDITPPIPGSFSPPISVSNMATYFINGFINLENTLTLKVYPEGLYAGGGLLNKAQGPAGGQFPGSISDKVTVELNDPITYQTIIYTTSDADLNTNGTVTVPIPSTFNSSYYVTVKHRNSIAIVSASPLPFSSSAINYDFSAPITNTFGSNLKNLGTGVHGMYGGDINNDGIVDGLDLINIENGAILFSTGYLFADVNGDGIVDGIDLIITENNSLSFISFIHP